MKLGALYDLAKQLGRMDLSLDPGASKVALLIAQYLDQFVLDNQPPTLSAVTQDAIDAARYRKLRFAHCFGPKVILKTDADVRRCGPYAPGTLEAFDTWADTLPSSAVPPAPSQS